MTRPRAFYATTGSAWSDVITVLHPPYTMWHLSYVAIGAAIAPSLDALRLGGTLLAFLFGLGVGAHALDEVKGRPLRTGLSDWTLWLLGIGGLAGGGSIAVVGMFVISPTVGLWAVAGILLAAGYALEWSRVVHSDWGFAVAWGAFPVLVGFWAQTETIGIQTILVAAAATFLSGVQRRLSTRARNLRRAEGEVPPTTGGRAPDTDDDLLQSWEGPLRLLSVAVPLLALGLLATHL